MSFAECTATSILPARSASSISFTKTPLAPISPNGLDRSRSPAVVIGRNAISWPACLTVSAASPACVSASREPREPMRTSTGAASFPGGAVTRSLVEPEEPAQDGCVLGALRAGRGLLHPHRRLVEELVHELSRDALEPLALVVVERPEARKLGRADRLGAGTKRSDCRHDLERGTPRPEALGLLDDETLGDLGLGPPPRKRLVDDRLEVVDVVEEAARQVVHGGVDIARNGDIDEEERPAAAARDARLRR